MPTNFRQQILVPAVVLLAIMVMSPLQAADRILFAPEEVTVDPGESFSVFVALDTGVINAHAYRVHIKTDYTLVSVDTVVETSEWAAVAAYQFTSKDTVINDERVYDAFSVYWLPSAVIDGYVQVAEVRMTALALGTCSLSFNYFLVKDNADHVIVSEFRNGFIRIGDCPYAGIPPGDVDASGGCDIGDLTYMVEYMFEEGDLPIPDIGVANFDCTGGIDISDLVYLVAYMFSGGPEPCDLCAGY